MHEFPSQDVENAFMAFPDPVRSGLVTLRGLILDVAAGLPQVGQVEECLKGGRPTYLVPDNRAATMLQLGMAESGQFALFGPSRVVSVFRTEHEDDFRFDGNQAIVFTSENEIRPEALSGLIDHALTYHLRKLISCWR